MSKQTWKKNLKLAHSKEKNENEPRRLRKEAEKEQNENCKENGEANNMGPNDLFAKEGERDQPESIGAVISKS